MKMIDIDLFNQFFEAVGISVVDVELARRAYSAKTGLTQNIVVVLPNPFYELFGMKVIFSNEIKKPQVISGET
jgi:hypothetical protein